MSQAPRGRRVAPTLVVLSILLTATILTTPSAFALKQIVVGTTNVVDINTAFQAPLPEQYQFIFTNPPFAFNSNATNISGFVIEGKEYWGDIPRTDPVRESIWNYSISNATETHYVQFENYVTQAIGFWQTWILVTVDGNAVYQLTENYNTFHPFGFDYRTSFIVGLASGKILRDWTFGNSGTLGNGQTYCPAMAATHGGCGPRLDLSTVSPTSSHNYTSALFISNPGGGRGAMNSAQQGAGASDDWYFVLNLTAPTAISVQTTYAFLPPVEAGFVYAFCTNCTSVADANADGVACNGLFTGLIFTFFGFCPSVNGLATYISGFIGGLITFPLRLIGSDSTTAGVLAGGLADLVQGFVSFYTFTLALILTSPIQLSIVVVGLGSSYSALIAAITGDVRIAFRGSLLTIKWFGVVIAGYFIILFYLVKALVLLVVKFVQLIISGIGLARSFFKLI